MVEAACRAGVAVALVSKRALGTPPQGAARATALPLVAKTPVLTVTVGGPLVRRLPVAASRATGATAEPVLGGEGRSGLVPPEMAAYSTLLVMMTKEERRRVSWCQISAYAPRGYLIKALILPNKSQCCLLAVPSFRYPKPLPGE